LKALQAKITVAENASPEAGPLGLRSNPSRNGDPHSRGEGRASG